MKINVSNYCTSIIVHDFLRMCAQQRTLHKASEVGHQLTEQRRTRLERFLQLGGE